MENGYEIDTWNVVSLYKAGSLMTVAKEISKVKFCGSTGGHMAQRWQ
jgi:hypothetical protein